MSKNPHARPRRLVAPGHALVWVALSLWPPAALAASDGDLGELRVSGREQRFAVIDPSGFEEAPIALTCSAAVLEGGLGACCLLDNPPCEPSGTDLTTGDTALLSVYWDDAIPDPYPGGNWIVDHLMGVAPVAGQPTILLDGPLDFGDLSAFAGETLRFCTALPVQIPDLRDDLVANQGASLASNDGERRKFPCACFCVNNTSPPCECAVIAPTR